MDKVTYFDVEYANSSNKSICQMGIVCEDYETGEPFYPERDIYINPEDNFALHCVQIHGITKEHVANEPTFPEIWGDIEKYFTNSVIVGHNVAAADLDALVKNLNRYDIDIPEMYYICTWELAKQFVPKFAVENYKLSTLCEYFDIDIDSEHNAFDDACACADLFR
ncbi:MAG: 3'-5' exoribonuclease, partial [Clostridia bacterium]|nr:3'-5' exoribonuclease [Clostridia bacterium]